MAHSIQASTSSTSIQEIEKNSESLKSRPNIKISTTTPPSHALRETQHNLFAPPSGHVDLEMITLPHIDTLPGPTTALPQQPQNVQDRQLQGILTQYLNTEKRRDMPDHFVLPFIQEQSAQLALPERERNWARAETLYLRIHGVDHEKLQKIKGGLFSGGWLGSGSLYALSGQMMTFAALIPAIYSASVATHELKKHPMYYAWVNLGVQLGVSIATPFVNSAMQIFLVARQELMRGEGQSARSKEMKARGYPAISTSMKTVTAEMDEAAGLLERNLQALEALPHGSPEWHQQRHQMNEQGEQIVQLLVRSADLTHEFKVRHDVINLNYVGQFNQSLMRVLRSVVNATSAIAGLETNNTHIGNYIQIGGTLLAMGGQQLWAGPRDIANKEQKTLEATIMSTRLVRPESAHKPVEELVAADLDLSDLRKQWKGPIETAKAQFQEYLDIEIAYCEQAIGDMRNLQPHEFRQLEKLENIEISDVPLTRSQQATLRELRDKRAAVPTEGIQAALHGEVSTRLTTLRQDLSNLKNDTWLEISAPNRSALLKAVSGDSPWALTAQTAWARMRLGADLIAQLAQRFGAQFAMIFAGTNVPLIMNAAIRLISVYKREEQRNHNPDHQPNHKPPISNALRDSLSLIFMFISISGALSTGAGVNDKITQRARLKEESEEGKISSRVGFQPRLASRAMRAIGQSMFAFPSAVKQRLVINSASTSNNASRARLEAKWREMQDTIEPNSP